MRIELYNCGTLTPEQYHVAVDALWNHFLDVRLDPRDIVIARSDRQEFWHEHPAPADVAALPNAPTADWMLEQDRIARHKAQIAAHIDAPIHYALKEMRDDRIEWRNCANRVLAHVFDDQC